jgi:hypothetical protein
MKFGKSIYTSFLVNMIIESEEILSSRNKRRNEEMETKKMLYYGHWELSNLLTGEVTESGHTSVYAEDDEDAKKLIGIDAELEVGDIDCDIEGIYVWANVQ